MTSSGVTLFYNADLITLEPDCPCADSLVCVDGIIRFVGKEREARGFLRAYPAFEEVNLAGAAAIPGFYEAHGHMMINPLQYHHVNFSKCPVHTMEDCLETIRAAARAIPEGEWVICRDFDEGRLDRPEYPTRAMLDGISTAHRIVVGHITGHSGFANSAAMELMPSLLESAADGKLDERDLSVFYNQFVPKGDMDYAINAVMDDQRSWLAAGITTMNDAGFSGQGFSMLPVFRRLIDGDLLRCRVAMSVNMADNEPEQFLQAVEALDLHAELIHHIPSVKLFYDGSIQVGTAYLTQPYFNDAANRGAAAMAREALEERVLCAYRHGSGVIVHTNGDAAMDDVLDAIEHARAQCPPIRGKSALIHAQTMRTDQVDRAKRLEVIPSFFAGHIYYWGDVHVGKYLGPERGARISPAGEAADRGMPFTLHCDFPVIEENPLLMIHCAVNRQTQSGAVLGSALCVSPLEALKGYTLYAALQCGDAERTGSLRTGKLADLAVLDRNPLICPPTQLKEIHVLRTIVGGNTVYER